MDKKKELEIIERLIDRLSFNEKENRDQIVELYMKSGKLYQSISQTDMAINNFNKVLEFDPGNVEAKSYLEYIYGILDYYYKETYNV